MAKKFAVKDANFFIDMESMGVLDLWFQLDISTIISELVVQKLELGHHRQALAYVESAQIISISPFLEGMANLRQLYAGISLTDASALYLAIAATAEEYIKRWRAL